MRVRVLKLELEETLKRKTSVSAVATVVADTGLTYWDHLERAKSALDKGIITQEDYDDLKQHYMKKLKEM